MSKILIHIEDPGALNLLEGVLENLKKAGLAIYILAEGFAAEKLANSSCLIKKNKNTAQEILIKYSPSLLIVGTSENTNSFGLELILEARLLDIYSIGLVDMWCNTSNRFRGNTKNALFYCPDEVFAPDMKTLEAFKNIGLEENRQTLVGNPVFKRALYWKESNKNKKNYSGFDKQSIDKLTITFIGEGWDRLDKKASMKNPNYTLKGSGTYDFRTIIVMEELIECLQKLNISCHTILRVHPNSNLDDYLPVANKFNQISIEEDAYEICMRSDVVVGMTSMLLLEACLLGKPTLSILPDIQQRTWMPNTEFGPTATVSSREELFNYWKEKKFLDYESVIPEWVTLNYDDKFIKRITALLMVQ